MIEVLFIASEVYPLIKTGGLADVVGALPHALRAHGVNARVLVPGYGAVLEALESPREVASFDDFWGDGGRLLAGHAAGLDLIVVDAPHLYIRKGGPYNQPSGTDWPDNWARFAALGFAGSELARGLVPNYRPDIVHAHDWQAALAPAYIKYGAATSTKSVMTIHNLAFQGRFDPQIFAHLRLPKQAYRVDGVEYYGGVGFLKAGLQCADVLTTVSPSYAAEIRTSEHGMGLDGLLNARAADLTGILNGIDADVWDPGSDPDLRQNFRHGTASQRNINKRAIEEAFGLEPGEGPIFAVVSRLTWQKGIDLLAGAVDGIVAAGGRLVVLGSGDVGLEQTMRVAAERHRGLVGVHIGYDEAMSHLIQGGADVIMVPSRFEPCGLTQLCGLRYGAVPLVSRVGGLADSVIDANEAALDAGVATGIQFAPVTEMALRSAIDRAITLFNQDKVWKKIQRRGMKADVSWNVSAARYAGLYAKLLGRKFADDK